MGACADLGKIYQNGLEGEMVDYEKALKFNQKACDGGVLAACANLGLMHASGQGTDENFAKAAELFERVCAGGEKFACSNLCVMYLEHASIAEDVQKGLNFLQKACDSEDFRRLRKSSRALRVGGRASHCGEILRQDLQDRQRRL